MEIVENPFLDKVITGDCIDVLGHIPDSSVDYIYSDLPYNLKKYGKHPKDADNFTFGDYSKWLGEVCLQTYRILKPDHYVSLQIGEAFETKKLKAMVDGLKGVGFRANEKIPYVRVRQKKPNEDGWVFESVVFTACKGEAQIILEDKLGSNYRGNLFWNLENYFTPFAITKQFHPCTTCAEIPLRLIRAFTNEGDLVLDMCNGTGTTTKIAKILNRHFTGIELYQWV